MSSQLLLFAEPLLRDGLSRLLTAQADRYTVAQSPEELNGLPQLVLWQMGSRAASLASLTQELQLLQERWQPAPLLLLLLLPPLPPLQPKLRLQLLPGGDGLFP